MKIYEGRRSAAGRPEVTVRKVDAGGALVSPARPLTTRHEVRYHSPDGFEWGYGGSGPSQLSLALCVDALGDVGRALAVYQHYKWQHVAKFPHAGWSTTGEQVRVDVDALEQAAART